MSDCWVPKDHCYDGSCEGMLVAPHYVTMPDFIQVFDTAVRNHGWRRWQRKLWRKARDAALARWGYPATVLEGFPLGSYEENGITLGPITSPGPRWAQNSYGGFGLAPIERPWESEFDPDPWFKGKGFALINYVEIDAAFSARVSGRLTGVMCHEIGHALGFGHGGLGIMESAVNPPYHPTNYELIHLQDYWGVA